MEETERQSFRDTLELPRILTLDAEALLAYCPPQPGAGEGPVFFDTRNRFLYGKIVKHEEEFDECPLYDQILRTEAFRNERRAPGEEEFSRILLILDFGTVFSRIHGKRETEEDRRAGLRAKVKHLMEKGLELRSGFGTVHMIPFDKSGSMSRKSRITFLNEDYRDELNERLDLGMDFGKIEVILSKYYAYRGLYLTSSKRIEHNELVISPETLVILSDDRINSALGGNYEKMVPVLTAEFTETGGSGEAGMRYLEAEENDLLKVETPFDGVGLVLPAYAGYLNEALGNREETAASFQLRMPFVKGMLHQVDFTGFLDDFDPAWKDSETYLCEDAFGIERDLKKAKILLTESMFKCRDWLARHCKDRGIEDPMAYYCDAFRDYGHAVYVSSTDLPYGKCEYTHLSYQMLNTLDLTEEEFEELIGHHRAFIRDPESYVNGWDPATIFDGDGYEPAPKERPAWRKALKLDRSFRDDPYIASRLENTKKGLITKLANGKLVVPGQTRFLCRDLMPLLASLLRDRSLAKGFYLRCLYMKFFLPMDESVSYLAEKYPALGYSGYCAFLRSPHLSRNEECISQPYVIPEKPEDYLQPDKRLPSYEKYEKYVGYYQKYFGHLTGTVMVPRGSSIPLCLGGADFDGDLVSVIFDENVVNAVRRGCYRWWLRRKLPVIRIPEVKSGSLKETVPWQVPYDHIEKTFSHSIGYLSNMAIRIGQREYGRGGNGIPDASDAACWKCTILTGLDIDAAKNGRHPDFSVITDNEPAIPSSHYLEFRDGYEKMRKDPGFYFDGISADMTDEKEGKILEIGCRGTQWKASFPLSERSCGTFLNELPFIFREEILAYEKEREGKRAFRAPFAAGKEDLRERKDRIDSLRSAVREVIGLYSRYRKFAARIRRERNRETHAMENLGVLIDRTYDAGGAAFLYESVLPSLLGRISEKIPYEERIGTVKERMNRLNWQFCPAKQRDALLEEIIGNGFRADDLDRDQKSFLFDFKMHGYKTLWHILSAIGESRITPLDVLEEEFRNGKVPDTLDTPLEGRLMREIRRFYENGSSDIEKRLYRICVTALRRMAEESRLSASTLISTFYEATGADPQKKRFFWDVFTWDEIRCAMETGKENRYAE